MSTATATKPAPAPAPVASPDFRLIESKTLTMPRAEAVKAAYAHQGLPNSPTERELDPNRVKELGARILSGTFLPCNWATVVFKGVKHRMNGRHSSTAIVENQDALPDKLTVHLDHYTADNAAGMGSLFRQFDARFSARSKADVSGAYQGLVDELQGIPRPKAKLAIEGACWYERCIEGLPIPSGDELYERFFRKSYHGFIRWLDRILTVKTPELRKAPQVAAMYATFIASESGAQDFWPRVAKNDLTDDADPRAVLSAELVKIATDKIEIIPADLYAKCIKAWNAFRAGDKIRSLNVNTKKGMPEIAA